MAIIIWYSTVRANVKIFKLHPTSKSPSARYWVRYQKCDTTMVEGIFLKSSIRIKVTLSTLIAKWSAMDVRYILVVNTWPKKNSPLSNQDYNLWRRHINFDTEPYSSCSVRKCARTVRPDWIDDLCVNVGPFFIVLFWFLTASCTHHSWHRSSFFH